MEILLAILCIGSFVLGILSFIIAIVIDIFNEWSRLIENCLKIGLIFLLLGFMFEIIGACVYGGNHYA